MKAHPAADVWPMLDQAGLDALAESIQERGQRNPITTWKDPDTGEEWILDGRNRWAACEIAGVEPITVRYGGDDPELFVLDQNSHRRHVKTSQRAMAVALTVTAKRGRQQIRKSADLTAADAAQTGGVSQRLVEDCRYIITHQPPAEDGYALVSAVLAGTIPVHAARKETERYQESLRTSPFAEKVRTKVADRALFRSIVDDDFPELAGRLDDEDDEDELGELFAEARTRTITAKASIVSLTKAVDQAIDTARTLQGFPISHVEHGASTYVAYAHAHGTPAPLDQMRRAHEELLRAGDALATLLTEIEGQDNG